MKSFLSSYFNNQGTDFRTVSMFIIASTAPTLFQETLPWVVSEGWTKTRMAVQVGGVAVRDGRHGETEG